MKSALSFLFTLLLALPGIAATAAVDPEKDWAERSRAPGVVIAEGFDDIRAWARFSWDKAGCNSDYQVRVDGSLAGCRNNAWDGSVRTSGKGSLRFDILPRTSEGGGGNIVIPFGDYASHQFGADSDLWISWRQKMDARFLAGFRSRDGRVANAKQVIIAQGDIPAGGSRKLVEGWACSENQVVVVASTPYKGTAHPIGYIECSRYRPFEQALRAGQYAGDARGSAAITRQNMRTDDKGRSTCVGWPAHLDQSGCLAYRADEWITYMVHLRIGPVGRGGYVDSTYELFGAYSGEDFRLLHRQASIVIPRGQYYVGGDPAERSSYKSGWVANNAHPEAKYGKLWLLPFMTNKDVTEDSGKASTWYDEVIISRCRIAAPGHPLGDPCARRPDEPSRVRPPGPPTEASAVKAPPPKPTPPASQPAAPPPANLPPTPVATPPAATLPPATQVSGNLVGLLRNLKPGEWVELAQTDLLRTTVNACKLPDIAAAYDRLGNGLVGCDLESLLSYSGGAYDSKGHRLLVWGGGHSGYAGNEIYAFDLPAGRWQRLSEPTPPVLNLRYNKETKKLEGENPPWRDPRYPPAPIAVHSYDQLVYLPDQHQFFAAGGSTFSGNGFATAQTWLYDLTRTGAGGWTEAEAMPGKAYGLFEYNMATAYDPLSRKVVMRGYSQSATFDPATGHWSVTGKSFASRRLGSVGEIDPKRRLFVLIGGGAAEVYPIGPNGELGAAKPLAAEGDREIEQCYGPGLEYDTKADRLVAWCSGGDVYALEPEPRRWIRHPPASGVFPGPHPAQMRGTWGRFRYMPEYDVFIVVNGLRRNVFLYRLAQEAAPRSEAH